MKHILLVLVGLTMLAACSPASSQPAASPATAPQVTTTPKTTAAPSGNQSLISIVKAGDWSGGGEDNFVISFTVGDSGNVIVNGIQVSYKATCGARASNITETVAGTEMLALKAGELKFTNANYEITFKAVAADRIEGTMKADGVSLGKLGQCSVSGVVWSASPK